MKFLIPTLLLLSGCGVSLTTSGFKAGVIAETTIVENGSKVHVEDILGISVQWLPYFSWSDVKNCFSGQKREEGSMGAQATTLYLPLR